MVSVNLVVFSRQGPKTVKRFERSNGLDTSLYKTNGRPLTYIQCACVTGFDSTNISAFTARWDRLFSGPPKARRWDLLPPISLSETNTQSIAIKPTKHNYVWLIFTRSVRTRGTSVTMTLGQFDYFC